VAGGCRQLAHSSDLLLCFSPLVWRGNVQGGLVKGNV
jgi:hypothetical protein